LTQIEPDAAWLSSLKGQESGGASMRRRLRHFHCRQSDLDTFPLPFERLELVRADELVSEFAGVFDATVYPPGYLEELRREWPSSSTPTSSSPI
jgi:hypothetical protein